MKKIDKRFIQGSGGGGKGSKSRQPREAPNTLQSRSTIKVVEVLSEGEVKGLVGGLKGVYLDDTVIQNADGTFNFPAVNLEERTGTPDQDYMPGFSDVESAILVNTEITTDLTRTTTDSGVDAVRITLRFPSGLGQVDTSNGDQNGYRVGIAIDVRPTGSGPWTTATQKTITGKAVTSFERSFRVQKPAGVSTTWQIRVRRTTVPSGSSTTVDRVDWFAYTEIQEIKLSYPDAAVVGLAIDSEATGGAIPRRSYLMDGLIVQVPTNYTPTVYNSDGTIALYGSYTGVWNGTFKWSWTDEPAWILYDLLTNERYGAGEYIDTSNIDIYSFYESALYNSQLIDDGTGTDTLEPRFRMDLPLQSREQAIKVIVALAASFRAMLFQGPGYLRLIQDRPQTPVATINNANVIAGQFVYNGTELENRITAVDVSYNDMTNHYEPRTVTEEDVNAQAIYGFNKQEITALGVIHEGQARRLARWAIDSALTNTESVTFQVSWSNATIEVGDVIYVADNWYADEQFTGIIKAGGSGVNQIKLDRPVTVTAGQKIQFIDFTGVLHERFISANATNSDTLSLQSMVGAENPSSFPNAPWTIFGTVEPRQFKIDSVSEQELGVYSITASYYDPAKFARVELGEYVDPPNFSNIGNWTVGRPNNVTVNTEAYLHTDSTVRYNLRFNWDDVTDPMLRDYKVRYRRNNGPYMWSVTTLQSELLLENVLPGIYEYTVFAYNTRGVQSPGRDGWYELELGAGSSPLNPPTGLALQGGGTTFADDKFTFVWNAPATTTAATLKDYKVEFRQGGTVVHSFFTTDRVQTVSNIQIGNWYGSRVRSINVVVFARDTQNRLSTSASTTFTNPAPAVPGSIVMTPFFNLYQLGHAQPVAVDASGVLIWHSTVNGFTPSAATLVLDDVGTVHQIPAEPDTTYYVKFAVYDTWSKTDLTVSAQQTVTTASDNVGVTPNPPTGLVATSSIKSDANGTQFAEIVVKWNRVTNQTSYDLEIISGTSTPFASPTVADPGAGSQVTYTFRGIPAALYRFRVRSRGTTNVSAWSSQISHTAAADTLAPAAPTGFTLTPSYQSAIVSWTNPTATDLANIEIWRGPDMFTMTKIVDVGQGPIVQTQQYYDVIRGIGTERFYKLRAVDASGNTSPFTATLSVTSENVPPNSITAYEIMAHTITANEIAAHTITANEINANSIRTAILIADSITAGMIQADAIQAEHIAAGVIDATMIGTNTIITNQANIANAVIVSAHLQTAIIQTAHIANAAITNAKIGGTLSSDNYVPNTSGWAFNKASGTLQINGSNADGRMQLSATSLRIYYANGQLAFEAGIF